MTTFQSPPAPPVPGPARPAPPPGARSVGGGVASLIAGVILLVSGLIMGGTGIALQALGDTWRRNGYVTPLSVQLTSPSYAIATERLDMEEPGQSWPEDFERLGSVRLSVTGTAGQPVFIGIAPADQVSAYLAGVRHATLIEIDDPATTQYTEHPGAAPVGNPAAETFWTTSATGTGTQHLEWPQRTGTVDGRGHERRRIGGRRRTSRHRRDHPAAGARHGRSPGRQRPGDRARRSPGGPGRPPAAQAVGDPAAHPLRVGPSGGDEHPALGRGRGFRTT